MRQHDQQCTPMAQNYADLRAAIFSPQWKFWRWVLNIGHEAKNCLVERRRWNRGECDEHARL